MNKGQLQIVYVLLLCLSITACGTLAPLPPPGAEQGAELQMWRDDADPIRLQVAQMQQIPGNDFALSLQGISAQVPFADVSGELIILAQQGRYAAQSDQQLSVEGPISIRGVLDQQPILGHAARAWFDRSQQALVCEDIWLVTPRYQVRASQYLVPRSWRDSKHIGDQISLTPTAEVWRGLLATLLPSNPTPPAPVVDQSPAPAEP